jgi:hypothetical protein
VGHSSSNCIAARQAAVHTAAPDATLTISNPAAATTAAAAAATAAAAAGRCVTRLWFQYYCLRMSCRWRLRSALYGVLYVIFLQFSNYVIFFNHHIEDYNFQHLYSFLAFISL